MDKGDMFVSKVTKETKQEIFGKVRAGEKVFASAKQYFINDKTIYRWLRAGPKSITTNHDRIHTVIRMPPVEYARFLSDNLP